MSRLAGVCTGNKWPAYPPNSKPASPRLDATLPHMAMARLLNAARAIFDPPGILKWEGLSNTIGPINQQYRLQNNPQIQQSQY